MRETSRGFKSHFVQPNLLCVVFFKNTSNIILSVNLLNTIQEKKDISHCHCHRHTIHTIAPTFFCATLPQGKAFNFSLSRTHDQLLLAFSILLWVHSQIYMINTIRFLSLSLSSLEIGLVSEVRETTVFANYLVCIHDHLNQRRDTLVLGVIAPVHDLTKV